MYVLIHFVNIITALSIGDSNGPLALVLERDMYCAMIPPQLSKQCASILTPNYPTLSHMSNSLKSFTMLAKMTSMMVKLELLIRYFISLSLSLLIMFS